MRFSSIVALVVVTASFALGGCAADAEPGDTKTNENVVLEGTSEIDRTDDARIVGRYAQEQHAFLSDEARIVETYKGGGVSARVDAHPPVFGPHGHAASTTTVSPEEMRDIVDQHAFGTPKP